MKLHNLPRKDRISLMFLSFLGSGYSPFAPGTIGSIATIPLIVILAYINISFMWLVALTVVLTVIACINTDYIQKKYNVHDPGWIVIDEVIGMLVTWMFIFPSIDPLDLLVCFIFFRGFDIIKIWPASYFDKQITHGSGTILDDVISAIFAGFCLLAYRFAMTNWV